MLLQKFAFFTVYYLLDCIFRKPSKFIVAVEAAGSYYSAKTEIQASHRDMAYGGVVAKLTLNIVFH